MCSAKSLQSLFAEAVELDLANHPDLAFALFVSAANQGLPEAEFNVAAMLDSGRGTKADDFQAAAWYARAASHGNRRAAYNLALLYEKGRAVPQNAAFARAWFNASGLKASLSHLTALAGETRNAAPASVLPPVPIFPADKAKPFAINGMVEIVWTSQPQPISVEYLVQIRAAVDDRGTGDVLSAPVETSSLMIALPAKSGDFQWRVAAVSRKNGEYQRSAWCHFSVDAPP